MIRDELERILSPEVLAGLADDDNDGDPDYAVIEAAWLAAQDDVRASVAGVLNVPDGEPTSLLRDIALTLAVERLYERRREVPPNAWSERAARARALLSEIAAGRHPVPGIPRAGRAVRSTRTPADRRVPPESLERL